jgi:hypothetical protein
MIFQGIGGIKLHTDLPLQFGGLGAPNSSPLYLSDIIHLADRHRLAVLDAGGYTASALTLSSHPTETSVDIICQGEHPNGALVPAILMCYTFID